MPANEYHFRTHWAISGTAEEAYDVIDNPVDLPRWWPAVYLDAQVLDEGDADGIGKVVALHTRGWLPYTLRWQFRVREKQRAERIVLEAWGDFVGQAIVRFAQQGANAHLDFDWRIRADKWILRHGSLLLKPIFAANHHWAMNQGYRSLILEIQRRRFPSETVTP